MSLYDVMHIVNSEVCTLNYVLGVPFIPDRMTMGIFMTLWGAPEL